MKSEEPLDPELAGLFRKEQIPEPPALARARVLGRLETAIAAMGAPLPGHKPAALAHAEAATSKLVAWAAAGFVAGGIAGGVAVTAMRPAPAPRVVYVDRQLPSSPPAAPITPPVAPLELPSPPPPLPEARPVPTPSSSGEALTAERLLIDDARTKLTSGDPNAALARLQDHARRFPSGRLEEEREALTVEGLVQSGRYDAARARAAKLRARWPDSVFLPAVDATIQSIP
jgi:hypothetical protein